MVHVCFLSAWLEGEEDVVIERVNQRIEDITGLTVETAELLQVMLLILLYYTNNYFISYWIDGISLKMPVVV